MFIHCLAMAPFFDDVRPCFHVKWVPCHHSMVCPRVTNGGDGLQIWKVAENILNKQSWTDDRGLSSSLGVGHRATSSSP
jgi:hypothetical protein